MPKDMTARDSFLVDCEPYFLDGAHTVAPFAQRTQEIIRDAVEGRMASMVKALGFAENEVALLDYSNPDKLQKTKPMDSIDLGVKLKVSDQCESWIYRYWTVKERDTGFCACIYIKGSLKLKQLIKKIDDLPDMPPGPEDAWEFEMTAAAITFPGL